MANQPSQTILKELNEAKIQLDALQKEWQETLDDLKASKENIKTKEIFAVIEYLTYCDQLCLAILDDLADFDAEIKHLSQLRSTLQHDKSNLNALDALLTEMKKLHQSKYDKMMNVDAEYPQLADRTLRLAQDLIYKFSDRMQREKITPTIMNEIKGGLEKELFLEELRDSLEDYREAREDYISALLMESLQKLPEDQIPEDLGEEEPEVDAVLSQLDTAITSCDAALLEKEIEE